MRAKFRLDGQIDLDQLRSVVQDGTTLATLIHVGNSDLFLSNFSPSSPSTK